MLQPTFLHQPGRLVRSLASTTIVVGLLACGNSGNSGGFTARPADNDWQAGVFKASSNYAAFCRTPRAPEHRAGSGLDERNFLRSWSHETYLWYDEIQDRNPANYNDTMEYFGLLKTEATTASGNAKDNFHHAMSTEEWEALAQSGQSLGYGATWAVTRSWPRELRVAYVEPGSPAAREGLERGDRILSVDSVDLALGDNVGVLNEGLWPSNEGIAHHFVIAPRDGGGARNVTMKASKVESTPVLEAKRLPATNIGYILFNDHIATAEMQLMNAIQDLSGVDELVLDIRYNGGGYLAIASQLAYMIAGPKVKGQTFEELRFNDKHRDRDFFGRPIEPMPFLDQTLDFSMPPGQSLPSLDLDRVVVLTGPGTCSASEAIINGLRGVDVEVIQIGSTTCGKPYGYYPEDNCGMTYFTIQFEGVNAKGQGGYADGFSPVDEVGPAEPRLPGCGVGDDFGQDLGSPHEGRLAAALAYLAGDTSCGLGASRFSLQGKPASSLSSLEARVIKPAALQGRVLTRHY